MRNGKCPKCGSEAVHSLTNGIVPGGRDREYVQFEGMYSAINIQSFVCTTCGYYENYLADPNRLAEIGQKWPRVPAPSGPPAS
jgi:hypothetical protein